MKKKYYHITNCENAVSILTNGIKCNEDFEIFLFDDVGYKFLGYTSTVANHIAKNQIFLDKYAMFEIDAKGITGHIENDNVAEITAKWQYILKQDIIKPEYINFYGCYETIFS